MRPTCDTKHADEHHTAQRHDRDLLTENTCMVADPVIRWPI